MSMNFGLDKSGFSGYFSTNEIGAYSDEKGNKHQYFTTKTAWPLILGYERVYKADPYLNKDSREEYLSYRDSDKSSDIAKRNAMKNSMLYVRGGAALKPYISLYNFDPDLHVATNFEVGAKIPIRFSDKKMKHEKMEYETRQFVPLSDDRGHVILSDAEKRADISYNSVTEPGFEAPVDGIHGFAPAIVVEERGVKKQIYSTIEFKQNKENEFPLASGYIENRTKRVEHEEILEDRREEYNSLVEKLKDMGVDNPDQFIKDYTYEFSHVLMPAREYDSYKSMRSRQRDINLDFIDSELPDSFMNIYRNGKNEINEIYALKKSLDKFITNSKLVTREPADLAYSGGRQAIYSGQDDASSYDNAVKTVLSPETRVIFDKMFEAESKSFFPEIGAKRDYFRNKYGIDIYDMDLSKDEYEVLTRANEVYEFSKDEIESVKLARRQLAGKIYSSYVKEVTKEQENNPEVAEYKAKEKKLEFKNWLHNCWVDIYNSQLTGTPYLDLKAGANLDISFAVTHYGENNEQVSATSAAAGTYGNSYDPVFKGDLYAQTGIGYVNNYFDISAGYVLRANKSPDVFGTDLVNKSSPYIQFGLNAELPVAKTLLMITPWASGVYDPKDMKAPNEFQSDYDRLTRANFMVRYEPANQRIMFGIDVHLPAKPTLK